LQQRLAKYLVHECFRNSELEKLHAGVVPDSKTGDYSDVIVKTPFGEIPWREVSRFDDAEMQRLMTDVVNRTYLFIHRPSTKRRAANCCSASAPEMWFPSGKTPRCPRRSRSAARGAGGDLPTSQSQRAKAQNEEEGVDGRQ
jgi:hypothetical protein